MNEFRKVMKENIKTTCSFKVDPEEQNYLYSLAEANGYEHYSDFFRAAILAGLPVMGLKQSDAPKKQQELNFEKPKKLKIKAE